MSIRDIAKYAGHEVVGGLRKATIRDHYIKGERLFVDDAGTEYYLSARVMFIVAEDWFTDVPLENGRPVTYRP